MEHAEATASHATERYLLGELTAAEADGFEQHYFDCAECAEELRIGMRLMNGGRDLAREAAEPKETAAPPVVRIEERRPRRNAWLPAAVAAALVLAVGAPLLLRQRDAASSFRVASHAYLQEGVRAADEVPAVDGNLPISLSVDVPVAAGYVRYEARLQRPDGPPWMLAIPSPASEEPTRFDVEGLSAGLHELVILGIDPAGKATELERHRFNVRR